MNKTRTCAERSSSPRIVAARLQDTTVSIKIVGAEHTPSADSA